MNISHPTTAALPTAPTSLDTERPLLAGTELVHKQRADGSARMRDGLGGLGVGEDCSLSRVNTRFIY